MMNVSPYNTLWYVFCYGSISYDLNARGLLRMKWFFTWIILTALCACSSTGLYKSEPCDNLTGQPRADCLQFLPSGSQPMEAKAGKKYLPTNEGYDASLQKIDDFTDRAINYLFY